MTDVSQPGRPRPPHRPPPRLPEQEVTPGRRLIAPVSYREHLEQEHGLTIVAEAGWPTEYKRYFLVRALNGTQKRLATFRGTLPEAMAHFYYLLHPEQRPRR
jgi:hypothetical protein